MTTEFTAKDLLGAVATFNADPFCVETIDEAEDIINEIAANGVSKVVLADLNAQEAEEYAEMAFVLGYCSDDELPEAIYATPNCLFAL